jgi:LysR family glycine cleavage system transcriptional activator
MVHLPSMKALRALEALGRLGSIRQAADELFLTRSAVSHQLRFLEEEVGFPLTEKQGRGTVLTPRGDRYAKEIRSAFRILARARESGAAPSLSGRLTVSCTPGFATYWLCPNIASFIEAHPQVELTIVSPRALDDISGAGVDIFIAYGQGDWPDMRVEPVAELEFYPVCSPTLLQKGLREPRDLAHFPLLHLAGQNDWARWLAATKTEGVDPKSGICFSDINLAITAAMAGQGISMGDSLTSSAGLAQGTLVQPFATTITATSSYYLVTDRDFADNPLAVAFLHWLRTGIATLNGPKRRA